MAKATSGQCMKCKRVLSKGSMTRHLATCLGAGEHRVIRFEAKGGPWWLTIAASPKSSLGEIDRLLRNTWLECCGHLSAFSIAGTSYEDSPESHGWGPPARSTSAKVGKVLPVGTTFTHDYDFGSTTRLTGKVVGLVDGGKAKVSILAKNEPIDWPCDACGEPAVTVCGCRTQLSCGCDAICGYCGESIEEMGLPVVNSPRMGVCGYTGD